MLGPEGLQRRRHPGQHLIALLRREELANPSQSQPWRVGAEGLQGMPLQLLPLLRADPGTGDG